MASEKNSMQQAVSSSRDNAAFNSVRGRFEVRKDTGAAKLNMTDEQWLQSVAKMQAEGAQAEI